MIRARLALHARREDGVALVLAIVVVAALTISTAALIQLTAANQRAFTRDKLQARAFNTAEEGLNTGISALRGIDPSGTVALGSMVGSEAAPVACCGGLGGWWAQKIAPTVWKVFAEGLSPQGEVLRRLAVQSSVDVTTVTNTPSLAWAYGFFIAAPAGCTTMTGTSTLTIPVFVNGDLCLNGTNQIEEPQPSGPQEVQLYVQGTLYLSGSAQVGSATRPILKATIPGGCVRNNQTRPCHQASQSRVYASETNGYGSQQSTLTKPQVDANGTYASGGWSSPVCVADPGYGSFAFDNDTSRNSSLGTIDLFPDYRYDCDVYGAGGGGLVGRLAWNPDTRTLVADGTIFLDGNLVLNGGDQAQYAPGGFAAIYVNGTATTNGNSSLCGPPTVSAGSSCPGDWDADQGSIGFVVLNAGGAGTSWSMSGNAEFDVLVYVVGHFSETGTATVTGPVITDSASVAGTPDHTDVDDPPSGFPGAGSTVVDSNWRVVPGSWQQLPVG